VVEIVQAQPQEFGVGFSSARIWVNQTVTPRVYFGDFSTGDTTIADGNNAALEICGVFDSTSSNMVNPNLSGYFDVLNFLWFQGSESLFQDTSGSYHYNYLLCMSVYLFPLLSFLNVSKYFFRHYLSIDRIYSAKSDKLSPMCIWLLSTR